MARSNIVIIFFTFAISLLCTPLHAEVSDAGVSEAAELIASGVTVVDIRRPEEWRETGVIADSKLLTYLDEKGRIDPAWVEKMKAITPPDKPVALICRTGGRSAAAARSLDDAGYAKIYNVVGGIYAWKGNNLPVVPPPNGAPP